MKKILFFRTRVMVFQGQSQYKINNKAAKKELVNANLVNKSLSLKTIQEKTLKKGQKISDIPLVKFPEQKLKIRASKSWKVTPQRPRIPGLTFEFDGSYKTRNFLLVATHIHTRATRSGNLYRTYPGRITFTAQKGGEYRMKISLATSHFPVDIWGNEPYMLVQLGDREIRTSLKDISNKEINVVFTTPNAGMINIGISGVSPDREKASSLAISAIQIDKI